jgi:hypothetical protein
MILAGGGALNACASIVRENEKEQDKTIPMMTEEILQIRSDSASESTLNRLSQTSTTIRQSVET